MTTATLFRLLEDLCDIVDTSSFSRKRRSTMSRRMLTTLGVDQSHCTWTSAGALIALVALPCILRSLGLVASPEDSAWKTTYDHIVARALSQQGADLLQCAHEDWTQDCRPLTEATPSRQLIPLPGLPPPAPCAVSAAPASPNQLVVAFGEKSSTEIVEIYQELHKQNQEQILELRQSLQCAKHENTVLKRKFEVVSREAALYKQQLLVSAPAYRLHKRYFGTQQGLSMALRCCLSNAASSRASLAQGCTVHASTIGEWKKRLHASCISFSHNWFDDALDCEDVHFNPAKFDIHICHIKSDATSAVWKDSKLIVTECRGVSLKRDVVCDCSSLDFVYSSAEAHRQVCDVLPQENSCAAGTHALLCKQLAGIGARTPGKAALVFANVLHIFLMNSDCGGDQVGAASMFVADCRDSDQTLFLRSPCFKHQDSLEAKASYKHAGQLMVALLHSKFFYFPTLAKTFNCWRTFVRNFFVIASRKQKQSKVPVDISWAKRTPPRCLSTRWRSAEACEDLLPVDSTADFRFFVSVLDEALAKRAVASKKATLPVKDADEDPQQETNATWSRQYSKWSKDVIQAWHERSPEGHNPFRTVLLVMKRAREPWSHFDAVLSAIVPPGKAKPLASLLWGKLEAIWLEFESLCSFSSWVVMLEGCGCQDSLERLCKLIFAVTLRNAAAFDRRIRSTLLEFPFLWLLLAKHPPDAPCPERKNLEAGSWLLRLKKSLLASQ